MDNPISDVMNIKERQLKQEPALRYDQDKTRYDLIPPEVIDALAKIYTEGAKKYVDRNWEKGMSYSRIIRCIYSHLMQYLLGSRYDKELPNCEHMAMIMWNAAAIITYDHRKMGREFNDLPHWNKTDGIITKELSAEEISGNTVKT